MLSLAGMPAGAMGCIHLAGAGWQGPFIQAECRRGGRASPASMGHGKPPPECWQCLLHLVFGCLILLVDLQPGKAVLSLISSLGKTLPWAPGPREAVAWGQPALALLARSRDCGTLIPRVCLVINTKDGESHGRINIAAEPDSSQEIRVEPRVP